MPSSQATPKTVKARSRELDQHREVVSGGGTRVSSWQGESRHAQEREKILEDLQDGVIPTSHALAMKADLGIPWSKLRAIRRSEKISLW